MGNRYTRLQAAEKAGTSASSIYRWEKSGKLQKPKKLARNGELVYTDEHIEAIMEFMTRTVEPTGAEKKPVGSSGQLKTEVA